MNMEMQMGIKGKDKFNSIFEKYKVILVVKEYFELFKTHLNWMQMGVQGKGKFDSIFEH